MKKQKVITYPWWIMKLYWFFKKYTYIFRILISALFLLSAFAKLYPTPMYGITKVFEEGQLLKMGFSENLAPYFSRFIIGADSSLIPNTTGGSSNNGANIGSVQEGTNSFIQVVTNINVDNRPPYYALAYIMRIE